LRVLVADGRVSPSTAKELLTAHRASLGERGKE